MDNNCLVTKLKSIVENNNLKTIGELKFKVNNRITNQVVPFAVTSTTAFDAKIIGNGYFYKGTIDSQTDITNTILNTTNTGGYRLSQGEYYVTIKSKYELTVINMLSDKQYLNSIEMNIDDLKYTNLTNLRISSQSNVVGTYHPINGDLSNLNSGIDLEISNTDITGTMIDMAKFYYPNYNLTGNVREIPSKNITGSIEEFVENLTSINYNKTIVLVTNLYQDKKLVTFNGTIYNNTQIRIILDDSGNATIYNGSSVLIGNYNRSNNIWTYN